MIYCCAPAFTFPPLVLGVGGVDCVQSDATRLLFVSFIAAWRAQVPVAGVVAGDTGVCALDVEWIKVEHAVETKPMAGVVKEMERLQISLSAAQDEGAKCDLE